MLIGAAVSPPAGRRRPSRAASSAARTRSSSSTRTRAAWKPRVVLRRRGGGVSRGDGGLGRRRAAHPRRLPAQLRLRGPGDPREVAGVADELAAGRARRSARTPSCCIPARRSRARWRRRSRARARSSPRRSRESEGCPLHLENTAGTGGTLGRSFAELATLDRARRRRRAARRVPGLLPPARVGLRHPHGRVASTRCSTSARRASASSGSARCTSTTRRRRSAPTATATRTSARARSAPDGCAVFLSDPRFDGLPCVLETPGPNHSGPDARGDRAGARRCASAAWLRGARRAARGTRRARRRALREPPRAGYAGAHGRTFERPTTFRAAPASRSGSGSSCWPCPSSRSGCGSRCPTRRSPSRCSRSPCSPRSSSASAPCCSSRQASEPPGEHPITPPSVERS